MAYEVAWSTNVGQRQLFLYLLKAEKANTFTELSYTPAPLNLSFVCSFILRISRETEPKKTLSHKMVKLDDAWLLHTEQE